MLYITYSICVIGLTILLNKVNNSKTKYKAHLETEPINLAYIYTVWFFAGLAGYHRKRLLNELWIVQFVMFASIIVANVHNVYYSILENNVVSLNIWTAYVGSLLLLSWIFDLFAIPYLRYLYISRYFRRDMNEMDILEGNVTKVEKFYKNLAQTSDTRNKRMTELLQRAEGIAKEENTAWFKWLGGGLGFEKERFAKTKKIAEEMNKLYDAYQKDADTLSTYLHEARCAAEKNIYLSRELLQIIRDNMKSNKKEYGKDNLNFEQTNISVELYKPTIQYDSQQELTKLGNVIDSQMKRILKNNTLGNLKTTQGKMELAHAGLQVAFTAIDSALNWINNRIQQRKELAKMSLEIVNSMSKSTSEILNNQGQILRASELLSALFNANKAFVKAYADMRDLCFGEISFKSFWNGPLRNHEIYETTDFKKTMQHLIDVSREYSKINQQTIN